MIAAEGIDNFGATIGVGECKLLKQSWESAIKNFNDTSFSSFFKVCSSSQVDLII
jgi:hypothetical protein